jgi:DNA-binding MarR family transcriptional regulator
MLSPGFWLHHAALAWRAELDSRLRPLGLTHTQFMLLASTGWLEHVGRPPTQQEVAEHAGADRMMTSRVVRTLEERGLLERDADEADGRALRLRLTESGRAVTRPAIDAAQAVDAAFFGADLGPLRAALRRLSGCRLPTPDEGQTST